MKGKPLMWTVGLLLLAALIGWFLPTVAFPQRNNGVEEAAVPVEIRRVDLSYETDLSVSDRMQMVQGFRRSETALQSGVYLRQEEVWALIDAFLFDLTDRSFSINEQTCIAVPYLEQFESSGSFVLWKVQAVLEEGWELRALLDDQSGVLLQCGLQSLGGDWDQLFQAGAFEGDLGDGLQERFTAAFASQLRRRLSEDWTVEPEQVENDGEQNVRILHLRESGGDRCDVALIVVPFEGLVFLNEG